MPETAITVHGADGLATSSEPIPGAANRYAVDGLDPDQAYTVRIDHPALRPWSRTGVRPGTSVGARLVGNAAVHLSVTDENGGSVPGAAGRIDATCEPFVTRALPPSAANSVPSPSMRMAALLTLLALFPSPQSTSVEPNPWFDESELRGRVVSPEGVPIPEAGLQLWVAAPLGAQLLGSGSTTLDGSFGFRVGPAPRTGVVPEPYLVVTARGRASSRIDHVYTPPHEYSIGDVVLHRPVSLRGKVTNEDGEPVAGASIHAALGPVSIRDAALAGVAPIATSGADGAFTCETLPPGMVTLGVSADGYADLLVGTRRLSGRGASNDLRVTMERGATARIRVLSSTGQPVPGARAEPLRGWNPPWSRHPASIAFWRSQALAGADGVLRIDGLPHEPSGEVLVVAPGHRPELADVGDTSGEVRLEPVTWLEVVARVREDGSRPALHEVSVRDGSHRADRCANCDEGNVVRLVRSSPAVTVLAPHHWRVEWNSAASYAHGGRPSHVDAIAADGSRTGVAVADEARHGEIPVDLDFPAPARLAGRVRDVEGRPISLRLGVSISYWTPGWLVASCDDEGRFAFDRIEGDEHRLYPIDRNWRIVEGTAHVRLEPGKSIDDWIVIVEPRPDAGTGTVRGAITIDGVPPGRPILLALDEVPSQHLPGSLPRGFAWTDAAGHFSISAPWPREYHLVPKHTADSTGGWRSFGDEFPRHGAAWPWRVTVPSRGTTEVRLDLRPESEWDSTAPPDER